MGKNQINFLQKLMELHILKLEIKNLWSFSNIAIQNNFLYAKKSLKTSIKIWG